MPRSPSEAAVARSRRPVQPPFSRGVAVNRRMRTLKKLQHPFALVAQGFVLGGILFFATHPASIQAASAQTEAAGSLLPSAERVR